MDFSHFEEARDKLNPNNLEAGLPGREQQSDELYKFLYERLKIRQSTAAKKARVSAGLVANIKGRHTNKTMFVCGVPGTGKTATIRSVEHQLKKLLVKTPTEIHKFQSVYINGQHLSAPNRIYSEIFYQLTGETCNPDRAQEKLDDIFKQQYVPETKEINKSRRSTRVIPTKRKLDPDSYKLIIVDELDILYNDKRQSIFYSLFDWPTSSESKVILIAIANAMDLPERFMRGRISSRMGWEKLVFEPYTSEDLARILEVRLGQKLLSKCFEKNAILVATKRIGRTTGDARRILDTCRLAIDKAIASDATKVTPAIIDKVGFQNLDEQRRVYIQDCASYELAVLKGILLETDTVGEDNVEAIGVYNQANRLLKSTKSFLATRIFSSDEYDECLRNLCANSVIILEHDKPLYARKMYIKDCGETFKDLVRSLPIISPR